MNEYQTETQFQAAVIEYAQVRGWLVAHFRPAQMRSGNWVTPMCGDPGFPDLVLARKGAVIFAELKRQKGKTSANQRVWLEALDPWWQDNKARTGRFRAYLWRPSDWVFIEKILR